VRKRVANFIERMGNGFMVAAAFVFFYWIGGRTPSWQDAVELFIMSVVALVVWTFVDES
jgi:hypothetical protein